MCLNQWLHPVFSSQVMWNKLTACEFCFMHLIRQYLDKVVREWNIHRIRPTWGARCPAGIPDELYFLPAASFWNRLIPYRGPLPPQVRDELQHSRPCEDETFAQYLLYLCQFHVWTALQSVQEAQQLYSSLLTYIWHFYHSQTVNNLYFIGDLHVAHPLSVYTYGL